MQPLEIWLRFYIQLIRIDQQQNTGNTIDFSGKSVFVSLSLTLSALEWPN